MKQANRMVGASVIGAAMLIGLCTPSAQAAFVVDLTQEGSNVVATGSGTINLTDLSLAVTGFTNSGIRPIHGVIFVGSSLTLASVYFGITGPTNFGGGGSISASSESGHIAGVAGAGFAPFVVVPAGYVSGTTLSDSITFGGATFDSLGVTPGTYMEVGPRGECGQLHADHCGAGTLDVGHDAARLRGTGLGWIGAPPDHVQRLVYGPTKGDHAAFESPGHPCTTRHRNDRQRVTLRVARWPVSD